MVTISQKASELEWASHGSMQVQLLLYGLTSLLWVPIKVTRCRIIDRCNWIRNDETICKISGICKLISSRTCTFLKFHATVRNVNLKSVTLGCINFEPKHFMHDIVCSWFLLVVSCVLTTIELRLWGDVTLYLHQLLCMHACCTLWCLCKCIWK